MRLGFRQRAGISGCLECHRPWSRPPVREPPRKQGSLLRREEFDRMRARLKPYAPRGEFPISHVFSASTEHDRTPISGFGQIRNRNLDRGDADNVVAMPMLVWNALLAGGLVFDQERRDESIG